MNKRWVCVEGKIALSARGQGAAEYLVLLAAVLIIALVSIALLGFFPGLGSDTRESESMSYWHSASPIAIVDWEAQDWYWVDSRYSAPVFRLRNIGNYPITITKILGEDQYIDQFWTPATGDQPITSFANLTLQPGSEVTIGDCGYPGSSASCFGYVVSIWGASWCTTFNNYLCAAKSVCGAGTQNLGYFEVDHFGFEYTEYVEGQQITKREVGPVPLVIKCTAGQ
jgi:hypothetical protein